MNENPVMQLEEARLKALHGLNIMDGPPEREFQDIVNLASEICEKPVAMISLLDKERQWFKAKVGMDLDETPAELALGKYAVESNDFFEVQDALAEPALKNHPFVKEEPYVRYYAGAPLRINDNISIGTLCVMDRQPGRLSPEQKEHLMALANTTMKMFLMKHQMQVLSKSQELLHALQTINEVFIQKRENKESLYQQMLGHALRVSESNTGVIAEISELDGSIKPVATVLRQNPESSQADPVPEIILQQALKTFQISIIDQQNSSGSYLCIPILESIEKPIGVIGLGKLNASYSESDKQILQPFLTSCITLILTLNAEEVKKKTEEENEKITRQLLNAQSIAKTGSWEFHMDTGEMYWSEEQYRIFELPPTEAGKLAQAANKRIDQKEREKNFKISNELALMGKPFSYRQKLRFEDGRTKTVIIKGSPVMNQEGQLCMIHGTCQDVTEQRQRALDLQRFFELSLDLLCIADADGKILKHSASFNEILGYSDVEIKGHSLFDLIHPEDLSKAKADVQILFSKGKLGNIQNRFIHKDGTEVLLEWTAVYDTESNRIYASAKDITGKAELEDLLIQSKIEAEKARAKDIFLANMSHEIRTPLNAIIGFNEILANTSLDPNQRKNVDIISSASKNLSVIINDILDVSKLESGKLELDISPFRIENTCRQVIQLQAPRAKTKGIKLFFSYDNEIPEVVKGDDVRLSQILINLISNAIKFTEKGHVELKVREAHREGNITKVIFSVADTGIGIPENKIKKIFERFSQAETYTTRIYGGTGLGLNIVKSLIELQDGRISVKSKPGEGSVFSFSINYEITEELDQENSDKELGFQEQESLLSGIDVLLVEDNEHNQLLAASYLEKFGVKLDLAGNGKLALQKLSEKSYDIILMDLQMPIMDGISTTEAVRQTMHISTPIIACSAHAMASERKKCLESGMNDYISKPYSEKTLIQTLIHYIPERKPQSSTRPSSSGLTSQLITKKESLKDVPRMDSKPSRSAPEWLEKAVLSKIPEDVKILAEAMENQDWKALEFKAHNLISSLSILHFTEGIDLSRKLESASHNLDKNSSLVLGEELIGYLTSLTTQEKEA